MFKPHYGTCKQCGKDEKLIVVKKGLCDQCNHGNKQHRRQPAVHGSKRTPRVFSGGLDKLPGEDIEGFSTVHRSSIRKKKKVQPSRKRTGKDQIREKVHFGKGAGLQGIKKEHTRIYMQALGYTIADFVPCELTGQRCNDVHHIYARGMGGSALEDELYNRIENLMGLTRETHTEYGDKEQYYDMLIEKHFQFLSENGVPYDKDFFEKWPK